MKQKFFTNLPLVLSILTTLGIASTEVPLWASAFSLFFVVWRFAHERFNVFKLSPKITPVFGLLFFIIVYIQHKTIFGQEESITILVGLTAITILNFETERDLLFLVLLGFLMVVLKSVFSLDFIWILPALLSYFGLWLTLISNSKVNRWRFVFRTTLRSVPMLVILFVVFPRFVLFQVNKNMNPPMAQSGFNEELTPGRFSSIALSDEMVFRVQFINTDRIDSGQLYWRGAVLSNANGFTWTKGMNQKKTATYVQPARKEIIKYRSISEPSSARNVFLLDKILKIKNSSEPIVEWMHSQFTFSNAPMQIVQFEAEAYFDDKVELDEDPVNLKKYLQQSELTPRAQAWVDSTKIKYQTMQERLNALVSFFEKPGFIYTLKPDYYGDNLDEFLFVKKKGYCEHFAAAFGSLARALEIPARVVIGYQGGTYNALSDFWKISQRDAHAWVEVGIDNAWLRIDPTGLVTPLRLTLGSSDYFSLSEVDQMLFSKNKNWKNESRLRSLYLAAYSVLDSLNYNWTMFLLNYDLQTQLDLLKSIKVTWFYMFFAGFVILLALFYLLKIKSSRIDSRHPLYDLMQRVERWARLNGVVFADSTPPLTMLKLIEKKFPSMHEFLTRFARQYELVVYREQVEQSQAKDLMNEWKKTLKKK